MHTFTVMNRVTLRTLHDVTQPPRCFDIGVLENTEEHSHEQEYRNCLCT
jgi:hypothetical protein